MEPIAGAIRKSSGLKLTIINSDGRPSSRAAGECTGSRRVVGPVFVSDSTVS
jgi:hypothetical protein